MGIFTHILFRRIVAVLCLVALFSCACTNGGGASRSTEATVSSKPPQIPPESSFVMDFGDFTGLTNTSIDDSQYTKSVSYIKPAGGVVIPTYAIGDRSNWNYAAFNVGFWNIIGALGLAVPVASFVGSFKYTPTQQPDYSWVWTYSVTVLNSIYDAELHGKYINNGVRWEMYISKQGEYSKFLWYYGESDLPATKGFWVLKNKPSEPNDLLRIDWQRNLPQKTSEIKYTNVVPGGPENGGYISFDITTSKTFDRSYTIFNKGKNQTTYIEWNSTSKAGRVKDSVYFKDDSWHCWDIQLNNAVCE
jgi:hypothetical protein